MEFVKQEHWSGLPFPLQGDLPFPGFELTSQASPALAGKFFTSAQWTARELPGKYEVLKVYNTVYKRI